MNTDYKSLFNLAGKIALITGAAGSIGREFAAALAQNGVSLALLDVRQEKLEMLKRELSGYQVRVEIFPCNLKNTREIKESVAKVVESFGRIDILLNHAGLNIRKPALEYSEEDWHSIVDVNAKGAFFMAQQVGRYMVEQKRGKIINTASVSSVRGHPNLCIYAMTKGAVAQMTKVLANEWARYNINVNAIAPGYIVTEQTEEYLKDEKVYAGILSKIPMGRIGRPVDLVGTMLFLSSPASDYLTGQTILIDGGRTID
ncbi:SDR family NAD(P)-dependent oxidoreductase [Desulfofundulus salinus]|uniref:Glucose 1-dehydrogenase n=1 Tax=Desulfofundulus salinus TaxID=2419843 RepID=A0A494WQS8_9FIRM|nr:glucose 1-dehydrogenase [Desulfofundulus salinum]RKO65496.1 glucose 1-dehydrogenase [Desulfofundulus salinum]